MYNSSAAAGFVLENMTIRDNTVPAGALFGGAVANFSALTIRNSTFVNNSGNATVGGSDVANRFAGTAAILNSTFTGSTGSSAVESTGASLDVRNSIVTGQGFACSTSGTITGAGNVTTDSPAICPGATATAAALGLTALADNGGPTPTPAVRPRTSEVRPGRARGATPVPTSSTSRPRPR